MIAREYGKLPSELWEIYGGEPLEDWERYALDRAALIAVRELERRVLEKKAPREIGPGEYRRLKERYMEVRRRGRPES